MGGKMGRTWPLSIAPFPIWKFPVTARETGGTGLQAPVRRGALRKAGRMPGGGRKRARPEGGYARFAGGPVTFLLRYVGVRGVGG